MVLHGQLSMFRQVVAAYYVFYEIRHVQHSQEFTNQGGSPLSIVQAFVHCRLDYCNSALAGL